MLKAAIVGKKQAALVEVPDPKPVRDWVLVKVHSAPMCTEYKSFLDGNPQDCLGHEAAGEVVEVAQPGKVEVGDRVVVMPSYPCGRCDLCLAGDYLHCRDMHNVAEFTGQQEGSATMAQYLLKPDWLLPKIPHDLTYDEGALACCALAPSFGGFQRANLTAFDTVLITGMGPVGVGAVVNARFRGARVIAVESIPSRQERARMFGAEEVLDPSDPDIVAKIRDLTDGKGVDVTLECSGYVAAQRLCLDAAGARARVVFIGESGGDELTIRVAPDLLRRGITIHGSWHYNLNDVRKVFDVIRRSPDARKLVTHTFPMSRIQEAFEISASREAGKIILHPWE